MSKLKYGDRIKWIYIHHFNSKSRVRGIKRGKYIGEIRHTIRHKGEELAMVKFDNNKGVSRVPISELIKQGDGT